MCSRGLRPVTTLPRCQYYAVRRSKGGHVEIVFLARGNAGGFVQKGQLGNRFTVAIGKLSNQRRGPRVTRQAFCSQSIFSKEHFLLRDQTWQHKSDFLKMKVGGTRVCSTMGGSTSQIENKPGKLRRIQLRSLSQAFDGGQRIHRHGRHKNPGFHKAKSSASLLKPNELVQNGDDIVLIHLGYLMGAAFDTSADAVCANEGEAS